MGIEFFPFRNLGYTYDFIRRKKTPDRAEVRVVYEAIRAYVEEKTDLGLESAYLSGLAEKLSALEVLLY